MTDRDTARAAKEQLREELSRLPGVTGVGLGRRQGGYVITVTVVEQSTCDHVPPHFHGVTVEVRVAGAVRVLPAEAGGGAQLPPQVTSARDGAPPAARGDAERP